MSKIYFSNDLNILYEKLKKNLTNDLSFATKKIVFIPNFHIKDWILKKFAREEIFLFIKFFEIKKILYFFNHYLFEEKKIFPNKMQINFALEKIILNILKQRDRNFLSNDFFDYLEDKEKKTFSKAHINFLSEKLSELFLIYSSFGEKLDFQKNNNWQIFLFNEVFKDKWTYPLRELKDIKIRRSKINIEINFFLVSYMPRIYFSFLESIPYTINYYILSPCKQFWQDLLSYKEITFFIKDYFKKRNSDKGFMDIWEYLNNSNHILANFGNLQKKYLKIIDNEETEVMEEYVDYENNSLLASFKKNILYLTEEKVDFEGNSIQIHEAPSKYREIEVLYNYILNLIMTKNISLSDIIIVSDDIDKYVSHIHLVFGNNEHKLNYKITDIKNGEQSFLSQGILKLFSLVNSRWKKEDVLELFDNIKFQEKHKFSIDDIEILKRWIEKANISLGIDLKHKKKILKNRKTTKLRTWQHGIERILSGFIYERKNEKIDYSIEIPIERVNFSDIDLFEKFVRVFEELKEDIKKFEEGNFLKLEEWKNLVEEVIEKNFYFDEEFFTYKKFIEDISVIDDKFKEELFEFDIIFKYLKRALKNKNGSYQANITNVIKFSSLEGLVPSKVICFLGMDEDFFKIENSSSLNLLEERYFPTKMDIKKDLFLRGIIFAEEYLFFSYVNISDDGQKKDMTILIKDILSFIDKTIKNKESSSLIFKHPLLSFDKNYFVDKAILYNFSKINYLQAKKYYLEKEKKAPFFEFKNFLDEKTPEVLDVEDLVFLSKNPIKFYFNKVLKIFLEEREDKTFFLPFLDKYKILQNIIHGNEKIILKNLEREGKFPSGYIREIAKRELKEKIKKYIDNLKYLKIEKINNFLFFLEKENLIKKEEDEILSSFELKVDGKSVKIRGKIKNISDKGLILFSDSNLKSIISDWPKILIFLKIAELKKIEKNVFFVKTKKRAIFNDFDVDKSLIKFIKYYYKALSSISPMIKEWSEILLFKDLSFFKKAVKASLENNFYEDIYLEKFLEKNLNLEKIFNDWSPFLQNIFKEVTNNFEIL